MEIYHKPKRKPRPFNESKEPLTDQARLVIHKDGLFSLRVYRKTRARKWRWEHFCEQIQLSDFARLSVADRKRLRKWEYKNHRLAVVPDFEY
jgi:hypothetical protein